MQGNILLLSVPTDMQLRMETPDDGASPSVDALKEMVRMVNTIVFPDFFGKRRLGADFHTYHIGVAVEKLYGILKREIFNSLKFRGGDRIQEMADRAEELVMDFIDRLPEVKRLLYTDVEAIYHNDPAAENVAEVILCYPGVRAMVHYRVAHALHCLKVPMLPRILTELAHSATGIDIHPGAEIGEHFAIDHGTGIVIGETCIIGNNVTIYQGVTLGAKNFALDSEGHPMNIPRHPILEDNVTVYSNSSILGRITVGHDSIIGGNVWLTNSVPPRSRILQSQAVEEP